jgi:hypothetical protein
LRTHLRLGLPSGLLPSGFPTNTHSCYMPCPSHPPWLGHSNYTWRSVQVMKFFIMQASPTFCHFISLRHFILLLSIISTWQPRKISR